LETGQSYCRGKRRTGLHPFACRKPRGRPEGNKEKNHTLGKTTVRRGNTAASTKKFAWPKALKARDKGDMKMRHLR